MDTNAAADYVRTAISTVAVSTRLAVKGVFLVKDAGAQTVMHTVGVGEFSRDGRGVRGR